MPRRTYASSSRGNNKKRLKNRAHRMKRRTPSERRRSRQGSDTKEVMWVT